MPRSQASWPTLLTLVSSLAFLPLAYSQASSLLPSTLPSCAAQCTVLQNAATSCESNPTTQQSCFCQSALLTNLKSSSNNICSPECSASDYATISAWYVKECSSGGTGGTTLSVVTVTSTASGDSATGDSAAAASTTAAASDNEDSNINDDESGQEWWNTHWQWVIMLIVLVVCFTAIGVGGRILYKRHQRKKDGVETSGSQRTPDMGMWAPSQHSVHDFAGPSNQNQNQAPMAAGALSSPARGASRKGKARESDVGGGPIRAGSRRLRKAANAMQM